MNARRWLRVTLASLAFVFSVGSADAEVSRVRVAMQFGLTYLPIMIMQEDHLIEKNAKAAGLGDVEVQWHKFSGGNVMNDALLSGNLDFAATGPPSFLILWDKASSSLDVKGVASYGATPLYLVTRNPDVHTIKDFSNKDRIALPAVKSSVQAIILQMAAEKEWGPGQHGRLDELMISRPHPDAMAAMLSGGTEINAHFTNHPFIVAEAKNPNIRPILNSTEFFGGPHTSAAIWSTSRFRDANPKTMAAFVAAMKEASDWIKADFRRAAEFYKSADNFRGPVEDLMPILEDKDYLHDVTPRGTIAWAAFMQRTGTIKNAPASWKELFFPEVHDLQGS